MLALVPYLQSHDGIPVNDVADEFGVSPKQIRDDLRLLMYTGVGEYAGELIDSLTLQMNRARQAEITQEILEVVAGADALTQS